MDIPTLVESLARKYRTRNPFEIARARNIITVFAPLIDIRGFYQYFQRNNIIYIDEGLPEHEQRFVCAHELGHFFLHKGKNAIFMDTKAGLNTSKYEIEANEFAACLLIPEEVIRENNHCTTEQLSRLLGHEEALIELRMKCCREIN